VVAVFGLGAALDLAHDHGVAERSLGGVVRRADAGYLAEGPERLVLLEQSSAEVCGLLMAAAFAFLQQRLDAISERGELACQPGKGALFLKVAVMNRDYFSCRFYELCAELAGSALALGDLDELTNQVTPAKLLLQHVQEVIAGVAV